MGSTYLTLFIVEILNFVLKTKRVFNMQPHIFHKLRKYKIPRICAYSAGTHNYFWYCLYATLNETTHLISIAWVKNCYYCCSAHVYEVLLHYKRTVSTIWAIKLPWVIGNKGYQQFVECFEVSVTVFGSLAGCAWSWYISGTFWYLPPLL